MLQSNPYTTGQKLPFHHRLFSGFSGRWLLLLAGMILAGTGCKKDAIPQPPATPEPPSVTYFDLGNRIVDGIRRGYPIDFTGDARIDVIFDIYLVGDPIEKADKLRWTIITSGHSYLPVRWDEAIPVFGKNNVIPFENFNAFEWYPACEILLMERKEFENGTILWSGDWLNVTKKYIPLSVTMLGKRHNAWIEISTDQDAQTLTVHRAGVGKIPEVSIIAGQ